MIRSIGLVSPPPHTHIRVHAYTCQVYTLSQVLPSATATLAVALLSLLPLVDTPTTLLLQAYLAQVNERG